MTELPDSTRSSWAEAWPDALAFAAGLALAWFGHWETRDLVWSLWLSSLMVGYAMIVWGIFSPGLFIATQAWANRAGLDAAPKAPLAAGGALLLAGGLFMLAFFTVHFGMFHFVHSVFLNAFFPVVPGLRGPSAALYWQVLQAYWPFVLVAAVAERAAFRLKPKADEPADISVKAEEVNRRLAKSKDGFTGMMAPYKNVVRLHLLIFFFVFASFAKLDNFVVYAVVYAVYFFPWRLIKREKV